MLDLDVIEARAKAATPGPLVLDERDPHLRILDPHYEIRAEVTRSCEGVAVFVYEEDGDECPPDVCGPERALANATFYMHAREDIPALVAEVRRLRAFVAASAERSHNWMCPVVDGGECDCGKHAAMRALNGGV